MKRPPDAIFAVDDFTALGVIKQLKEQNIEIPRDFGIVGFGNELFGEHISPGLSTVDQQTVLMGKESFTLLMDLIQSKGADEVKRDRIMLAPNPIYRDSSKRNPETFH
jgi:LacI family transcriptional regulator